MSFPTLGYSCSPPGSSSSLGSPQLLLPGALPSSAASSCEASAEPSSLSRSSADQEALTPSPAPHLAPASLPPTMYSAASSLLSYGPAAARMLSDSVYTSAYAAQGYMPFGADPSAFYSPLVTGGDNSEAWRSLSASTPGWPYDPSNMTGYPYGASYGGLDVRRKNATRESTSTLKAWLYEHIKNPYPTKGEKIMLAIITKMTLTQVSTWFANARRRLKKENKMQWSPRNRAGDDDDDKNSDDDDDDDKGDSNNNDDAKRLTEEDEDVVVDGGNDDSLLSTPPRADLMNGSSLLHPHQRCFDLTLGHKDVSSSLLSRPTPTQPCAARLQGLAASSSSSSSSSSAHLSSLTSPLANSEFGANPHKLQAEDKPRIWSLADVATSSTPPSVKRPSPPPSLAGLHGMQPPSPPRQPAFSSGFQPWVCSNSTFAPSCGSYGYSALPSHPSLGPPSSQGHLGSNGVMGGHSPARPTPTSSSQLLPNLGHPSSSAFSPKGHSGALLGEKADLHSLPSFSSTESHTAFKPVAKRL